MKGSTVKFLIVIQIVALSIENTQPWKMFNT